jgi:hypothetical protein
MRKNNYRTPPALAPESGERVVRMCGPGEGPVYARVQRGPSSPVLTADPPARGEKASFSLKMFAAFFCLHFVQSVYLRPLSGYYKRPCRQNADAPGTFRLQLRILRSPAARSSSSRKSGWAISIRALARSRRFLPCIKAMPNSVIT